ncbi:N-acetylmuramoyl-L-alanine amidase [Paenibacillus taiwanensis]|uniref:N-acetylmuramoyl-L-alanine amidase n=1 Tax=Paenibacillus taiwanensis TaxID=401638 RepID=UPI000420D743|nr:peptidoglycan recognition family protein [Paenibacillus taiwanensis]
MNIVKKIVPSKDSRNGQIPKIIVNHISLGSMGSMYNTFSNPNNSASSHFGVSQAGDIHQYVELTDNAWTQGRILNPSASIIKQLLGNPNRYACSIEHEGYDGRNGDLTETQFWASCWLHKYIQTQVQTIYGIRIPLNSHQVIGHYQIDSVNKPYCPGLKFPWSRLYAELAVADTMSMEEYSERVEYQRTGSGAKRAAAYAIAERVQDLGSKLGGTWDAAARMKLMYLAPVAATLGATETPESIAQRTLELWKTAQSNGKWVEEALRKLLLLEPIMKEKGLL